MNKLKELQRQRNWLLIGAFPFLPVFLVVLLFKRVRKKQSAKSLVDTYARFHGRDPEQMTHWFDGFRDDVVERLKSGGLHEMLMAARKIEPLIPLFDEDIPVQTHPITNPLRLTQINAILELQERLDFNRFDTIVVTSNAADASEIDALIDKLAKQSEQILVIDTSRDGFLSLRHEAFQFFAVSPHVALLEDWDSERVLFELIRSVQPKQVVLADSQLIWNVMSVFGLALAAAAEVSAFFSARSDNPFTQKNFYRFFEMLSQIHVIDDAARQKLSTWFVLGADDTARLTPLDAAPESVHPGHDLLPAIGGTDEPPCDCDAGVDISLIVTAHNETIVTGVSMLAANASVEAAERAGYSVERIIVLDAATEKTRACLSHPAYSDWHVIELAERDLGRARNRVVRKARGKYIAFLDADDLFSENWLTESAALLDAAEAKGEKVIAHPELNWLFDGAHSINIITPQDSPVFSPVFFYFSNYYDSLCMTPRQAHLDLPYVSRDIPNGLSYQDYQFAIETMDAGWQHRIALNTIIFKRRRDSSLVTESRDRKSVIRQIEPLSIENIPALIAPPMTTPTGS